MTDPRRLLTEMFAAATASADPKRCLAAHLPPPPKGRLVVLGMGKAAASMAAAVEAHYGAANVEGLVVTRYGHGHKTRAIEVREASHPVPDQAGANAARELLSRAARLGPDDLALCLISGGGSALTTLPAEGITLDDMQGLTRALLASGATINDMNAVRKHLSRIAGGRLAATVHPARLVTITISDVAGDDPSTIASGPTVPDSTTLEDARAVLAKYKITPKPAIARRLADPEAETPKPGDAIFANTDYRLAASGRMALDAAARLAWGAGFTIVDLGDALEGEARALGREHAAMARARAAPVAILSGGETTVTVVAKGRGGRNAEYALGLALGLDGAANIWALAADTDGIDGTENNAGVIVAPDTLARAREAGLDPAAMLARNDAYGVFAASDGLVVTGPTLTNVNDFRAILVLPG